jgi:type IV pilus assembly protein PilW
MMNNRTRQRGLSLVEMMVALALGMLVIGLSLVSYVSMTRSATLQDEGSKVEQNGRFALDTVVRTLRMAGYRDWNETATVPAGYIAGSGAAPTVQGSDGALYDTVSVRYFGSTLPAGQAVGRNVASVMDCTGATVAANTAVVNTVTAVDDGSGNGTGNLTCQGTFLVGNVERLQFLYGLDTNGDEQVDTFVKAADMTTATWNQVVAIRVALVVAGALNSAVVPDTNTYQLFGPDYTDAADAATYTPPAGVARNRVRRLFTATVRVRNFTGPTSF